MSPLQPVAVLHQQAPPPPIDGVSKPFKPGGYRDSGADIAYALAARGLDIVTPVASPRTTCEADWTFADTREGIVEAVSAGTRILWANTVLHARHSLVDALERGLSVVAHDPALVERHDDKVITNALLERHGLSVPPSFVAGRPTAYSGAIPLAALSAMFVADRLGGFPVVVKPIRGRGSQGVRRVDSFDEMIAAIGELTSARDASSGLGSLIYGEAVIVERSLSGEECTVAVLPPGR